MDIWNPSSTDIVESVIFSLQPQNKKLPCCVYLAALAVTDNLFLINCFELTIMMGFFPEHFKDSHCKFMVMHFQVCKDLFSVFLE